MAGYVAPPSFAAGDPVLAPHWRTLADDAMFLAATKPTARGYRNAALSGDTGAFTDMPFDQINYDSHAGFDLDTGVYTCPLAGYYEATTAVHVTATAGGQRLVLILTGPSGGQIGRGRDSQSHAAGTHSATATAEWPMAAGEAIAAQYYMDLALAFVAGSAQAYLSIDYVRPL